jgi:hypothetical protein
MGDKHDFLLTNETWELRPLLQGYNAVEGKWIFKTKLDATFEIMYHKTRLVARAFSQVHGVDFIETFVSMTKFTTVKCIVAIEATLDLKMHQMDMKMVFFNEDLEEDIYKEQPNELVQRGQKHLVCKLKKSFYGLKEASRAWSQKIDTTLLGFGFQYGIADHCLYLYFAQEESHVMIVLVYVDDFLILTSNMDSIGALKSKLEAE